MTKKHVLVILFCSMLISAFAATRMVTVQASPAFPWGTIKLYAMISSDLPYATWTGGYHDIMFMLETWLEDIGIDLEIRMYDSWTIWSTCWEEAYNVPSTVALPPNGWDITTSDWWVQTSATIWQESMFLNESVPPTGFNIMSYSNEKADELLYAGIHTLDAETRRDNLWDWQREFMHDPPMINMFYPWYYDVVGNYTDGYEGDVYFSRVNDLALHPELMPPAREALGTTEFRMGCDTDMPNVMSLYMSGYTQSGYTALVQDTLYMPIADYDPINRMYDPASWRSAPELAADFPVYRDGPNGPRTAAVIPVRDDVWWVDMNGNPVEKFDAYDVEWSVEAVIDPATGSPAAGEWIPAIESVDVLSNATLIDYGLHTSVGGEMYEPYAAQINLKTEYGDLEGLLATTWGAGMLPRHLLGGISYGSLRYSDYYSDPSLWHFTGPYVFNEWVPDEYVRVTRNPHYYGNGSASVDSVLIKLVPEDATRNAEIEANTLDAQMFTWAPIDQINAWKNKVNYPNLHVLKYEAPQSNNLMFNLLNPILSNRYVRLAIAHVIDYDYIASDILPTWGIDTVSPGKTSICPHTFYTEPDDPLDPDLNGASVTLFNEETDPDDPAYCPPYEYDVDKAIKYMEMWWYSQVNKDEYMGPVGDGDFNGHSELKDYTIWASAIVNGQTSPPWEFPPGNDYDPDYDNDGDVQLSFDYYRWANYSGYYWPEGTEYWQWSR